MRDVRLNAEVMEPQKGLLLVEAESEQGDSKLLPEKPGLSCRFGLHDWSQWSAPVGRDVCRQDRFCLRCRKHEFRQYCRNGVM